MALLHLEGFEVADSITTYLGRKLLPGSQANEWVDGRFGGKAMRIVYNNGISFSIDNKQTLIIGFAINFETIKPAWPFVSLSEGGTNQVTLEFGEIGSLRILRDSNVLATTVDGLMTRGAWHYIELKIKIDNSVGTVEIHFDGIVVANETGLDTQMTGNASIDTVSFGPTRFESELFYDDIYIADDSGSYNNDFLGDVRIIATQPDADGSSTDFTLFPGTGEDHYENVDDGSSVDDDTTYVESATTAHEDRFTYIDLVDVGNILGIQIFTDAKESAGAETLITTVRTYTIDHDDTPQAVTSLYLIYSRIMDVEPENTIPWTSTIFNQAMFGVKVG